MQREIRCLPNQYVEQESIHLRQTSDSNLQQILDLPLPPIHDEFLYQSMDPWTAASLDGFKSELVEAQESELDIESASISNQAGWTPLMYSVYLGHIETTKRLLYLNVDVEQKNLVGRSALMLAATCGKEQMIHLLLKHTKNTNICDRSGRTALHIAILYGQVPSVEPLLKHGFDPNLPDKENQMTPMLIACESERPEFVDCLLKHGGNPRLMNKRGQNGEALAAGNKTIMKRLQWHNKMYEMFEKEGLLKYLTLFEANDISQSKFIRITTQQLVAMGITLLGPQKKIESLVNELNKKLRINGGVRSANPNPPEQINQRPASPVAHSLTSNDGDQRLKLMASQLSSQYILNERIIERLKDIRGMLIDQTGNEQQIRYIIQALDESNAKILSLIR